MTKQEAIEKAWVETGLDYEKIAPMLNKSVSIVRQDGWIAFNMDFKKIEGYNSSLFDFIVLNFLRPKSLKGIENNNGWIKIESEYDLAKDHYKYSFVYNCTENIISSINNSIVRNDQLHELFLESDITHYQPIIKPKPPIY